MEFDFVEFRKDLRWGAGMTRQRSFRRQPMTQKERAKILEISQSKLSRLEAGNSSLKVMELINICNKIETNPKKYFIDE